MSKMLVMLAAESRTACWLLVVSLLLVSVPGGGLASPAELAARPDGLDDQAKPEKPKPEYRRSGKAVMRVQEVLSEMGLYLGPINGHLNEQTEAAIRVYQKNAGLVIDGRITRQLWEALNNAAQVRSLLKRLDEARRSSKNKARNALLAHPATRDLVTERNAERADPTRDVSRCFEKPTVRCLIDEASESVKAVHKPELRDWALGEVLVAQARAGLGEEAMRTAARMRDPRLIMVALRDIAEAQAASGRGDAALEAADIIPDIEKKAEALLAIAGIFVRRGDTDEARATLDRLFEMSGQLKDGIRRISFLTKGAVILAETGNREGALKRIDEAEDAARSKSDPAEVGMGLRYVASALADMAKPGLALNVLDDISAKSERTPVLMSTAPAQARAGDAAAAMATAETIGEIRYRAVVLGRIALAEAEAGDFQASDTIIETALAAVDTIDLPYARSYAISRLALSLARIGSIAGAREEPAPDAGGEEDGKWSRFDRAAEVAGGIDDNRLRAHTLWIISADQQRAGDETGAAATGTLAEAATDEIKSRLTRVWMFSELAAGHARADEMKAGWDAFESGVFIARDINNAWGRARASSKLARTLVDLVYPGKGIESQP